MKKEQKMVISETILTMLASEDVLKKDWDKKADEKWNNKGKNDKMKEEIQERYAKKVCILEKQEGKQFKNIMELRKIIKNH
ncbi:hypothetical protein HZC31_02555 [Candidatus Woesearchaeota archaeon]|nr:hypothetical protein [Candidatus Woesearchaeota archaeon]